jgi:hypothetical protein
MPIHFAISLNSILSALSRSRSKCHGAWFQGNASKSCRAVHSWVALAVHRKMHQTSKISAENHEREHDLERDRGHDEEI